jgi:shikimate kinase
MLVEDIIPRSIAEGPNDPSIYKAIFLAGGPGSGKSFIVKKSAFKSLGFKIVNSDTAFERYLADRGLKPDPNTIYSRQGQEIRSRAVDVTDRLTKLYLGGHLGLVIDGTGKNFAKTASQSNKLRDRGYDTAMVFVNTDLETAQLRNKIRDRELPENVIEDMWHEVQRNLGKYQSHFGEHMYIIDNSEDANTAQQTNRLYNSIRKWAATRKNTRTG